jgi:hypothetical protein
MEAQTHLVAKIRDIGYRLVTQRRYDLIGLPECERASATYLADGYMLPYRNRHLWRQFTGKLGYKQL